MPDKNISWKNNSNCLNYNNIWFHVLQVRSKLFCSKTLNGKSVFFFKWLVHFSVKNVLKKFSPLEVERKTESFFYNKWIASRVLIVK